MTGRLADKVAIVTGGNSGMGAGTVELFVAEGARVMIAARGEELGQALADRLGENVQVLRNLSTKHFADHGADVRSLQTQRDMRSLMALELFKDETFETVLEQFKKLHIRETPPSE